MSSAGAYEALSVLAACGGHRLHAVPDIVWHPDGEKRYVLNMSHLHTCARKLRQPCWSDEFAAAIGMDASSSTKGDTKTQG
jgi:hypothetical protein